MQNKNFALNQNVLKGLKICDLKGFYFTFYLHNSNNKVKIYSLQVIMIPWDKIVSNIDLTEQLKVQLVLSI